MSEIRNESGNQDVPDGIREETSNTPSENTLSGVCDAEVLKKLIDSEERSMSFYCELAKRCSGVTKRRILEISGQEKGHMCRLQTELFLLTGHIHAPPDSCPLIDGIITAFGMAYRAERKAEATYIMEAGRSCRPELSELYRCIAAEECCHAEIIKGMVQSSMCM